MELNKAERELIESRISNLRKYIESSKEQTKDYEKELAVLEKVLK